MQAWNAAARAALDAGRLPEDPLVNFDGLGPLPTAHLAWAQELQAQNITLSEIVAQRCGEISAELDDTRRQQRSQKAALVPKRSAFLDRTA